MKGKMPEDICVEFIQKYSDEKKTLAVEIADIETIDIVYKVDFSSVIRYKFQK